MPEDTPAPVTRRLPNGDHETTHPDGRVETRRRGGVVEMRHEAEGRTVTSYPKSRAHPHGHTETRLDVVPGGVIVSEPPEAEAERFKQRIKDRAIR